MIYEVAALVRSMLTFDSVSKYYADSSVALEDVAFSVRPKEFVSVVGHSGAGKTTLLKLLLAEERPSAGSVYVKDENVHALSPDEMNLIRRNIGVVFQDFRLLPHKTIYENISFVMEAAGQSDETIEADVPYALELVGLEDKAWNFPHEISGGEKQRAAIARAIVNQPDVVVADEPTGNLDPANTEDIIEILKKINQLGTLVFLTTHNKAVIDSLEHRVISMEHGRIVKDDSAGRYVI